MKQKLFTWTWCSVVKYSLEDGVLESTSLAMALRYLIERKLMIRVVIATQYGGDHRVEEAIIVTEF